jgi:vacuolar-type H+-ATPase subunit C/Vma6
MPGMGERSYAYAKACGIIGKSFTGSRVSRLGGVTRLSELDRLLFPDSPRDIPERELLVDLEQRIIRRGVTHILAIVDSFRNPPALLRRLARAYEYDDVKRLIASSGAGGAKAFVFTDLGRFGTVRFDRYPDLPAMLGGTEFAFLLKEDLPSGKAAGEGLLSSRLDKQYYELLLGDLEALPRRDKSGFEKIFFEEISLRNVVWALRLRTYYRMSPQEIRERLIDLRPSPRGPSLAADALASLGMALDNRADWRKWKRLDLLNQEQPGEPWQADPRYVQNAAAGYLYRLARLSFRRYPFSLDVVSCFIKLKLFEEDLLTSMAEGLGLGMSVRDVSALLEMES